jgi:hypothetical protein
MDGLGITGASLANGMTQMRIEVEAEFISDVNGT